MILSRQLASVCGRVVGFELRACVQTTDHHCSAAGSESSRRTAPHGPACRPAAPSLCLYFVILSSSYYRISSVISCVCAPPSIRILLPSVAHQVLYPCCSGAACTAVTWCAPSWGRSAGAATSWPRPWGTSGGGSTIPPRTSEGGPALPG